jgi:peroxiredoxin
MPVKMTNYSIILSFAILPHLGCERTTPEPQPPAASHAANQATETQSAPEKAAEAPRAIPTTAEDQQVIGTLPEGVGLEVGATIPDVEVHDGSGQAVSLASLVRDQPTLIFFYRGGWCPFCNFQIRELTEAHAKFEARSVKLVAISVDQAGEAAKTQAAYTIPFPVLSDPDLRAHEAFRVVEHVSPEEIARLKGMGLDLEAASGREHGKIAVPAVFLIDADAKVTWAHANRDYRVRPTIEQLLNAIDGAR